jgi:ComF family protein
LGDFFSLFLISIVESRQWNPDLVIPVPISKSRRKFRGYNQSELLSRPLARYFLIPHENEALIRVKDTESQIQLSAEDRFRNMNDAFFGNPAKLKGKSILVIDDIITTGATMNQCAKALFKAGADKVYGLSVAKTIRNQA